MRRKASPQSYFAAWGPTDGPIRYRDAPGVLGVMPRPGATKPIGIAFPVDLVEHPRGAVALFRLAIDDCELLGRYVCHGRQFLLVDQWYGLSTPATDP